MELFLLIRIAAALGLLYTIGNTLANRRAPSGARFIVLMAMVASPFAILGSLEEGGTMLILALTNLALGLVLMAAENKYPRRQLELTWMDEGPYTLLHQDGTPVKVTRGFDD